MALAPLKPPRPTPEGVGRKESVRDDAPDDLAESPRGWHESSLDLESGLDAFESDWPDDLTIPGAFDP